MKVDKILKVLLLIAAILIIIDIGLIINFIPRVNKKVTNKIEHKVDRPNIIIPHGKGSKNRALTPQELGKGFRQKMLDNPHGWDVDSEELETLKYQDTL